MTPLLDSDRLECQPDPSSVRTARLFVLDKLQDWQCDELVDSATLLTSELATNAVRHTDRPYTVTVSRTGRTLRVEVFDTVGVLPDASSASDDSLGVEPGALFSGLGLVDRIAANWGSELVQGGKVVWFELQASDGERRSRTSDLADLRSPAPGEEAEATAIWDEGEDVSGPPNHQEAPVMAKHAADVDERTDQLDPTDRPGDQPVVVKERRRHPLRWLLLILVIAALAVGGFFALGGEADVDVDVNPPEDVDLDVNSGDAPDADADADAG
jgi:anti-sigma regulatory factor (Ser/Thr protein kinase)